MSRNKRPFLELDHSVSKFDYVEAAKPHNKEQREAEEFDIRDREKAVGDPFEWVGNEDGQVLFPNPRFQALRNLRINYKTSTVLVEGYWPEWRCKIDGFDASFEKKKYDGKQWTNYAIHSPQQAQERLLEQVRYNYYRWRKYIDSPPCYESIYAPPPLWFNLSAISELFRNVENLHWTLYFLALSEHELLYFFREVPCDNGYELANQELIDDHPEAQEFWQQLCDDKELFTALDLARHTVQRQKIYSHTYSKIFKQQLRINGEIRPSIEEQKPKEAQRHFLKLFNHAMENTHNLTTLLIVAAKLEAHGYFHLSAEIWSLESVKQRIPECRILALFRLGQYSTTSLATIIEEMLADDAFFKKYKEELDHTVRLQRPGFVEFNNEYISASNPWYINPEDINTSKSTFLLRLLSLMMRTNDYRSGGNRALRYERIRVYDSKSSPFDGPREFIHKTSELRAPGHRGFYNYQIAVINAAMILRAPNLSVAMEKEAYEMLNSAFKQVLSEEENNAINPHAKQYVKGCIVRMIKLFKKHYPNYYLRHSNVCLLFGLEALNSNNFREAWDNFYHVTTDIRAEIATLADKIAPFAEDNAELADISAQAYEALRKSADHRGYIQLAQTLLETTEELPEEEADQAYDAAMTAFNITYHRKNVRGMNDTIEALESMQADGYTASNRDVAEMIASCKKTLESIHVDTRALTAHVNKTSDPTIPKNHPLIIDRLTMIMTDSASIRDVILFPLMRPSAN